MNAEQPESREPTIFNSPFVLFFVGIFLFIALLYRQNDFSLLAVLTLVVVGGANAWTRMTTTAFSRVKPLPWPPRLKTASGCRSG